MESSASRRKPYVPIDTCSPGGTWIEEKRYNKVRHDNGAKQASKVLCGNWQEEKALEDDLIAQQPLPPGTVPPEEFVQTAVLQASLDVIREGDHGRYTGGHQSTPYVTSDARNPNARFLQTTQRYDYCEANGDVRRLRRPDMGVRSRVMLGVALEAAKAEKEARDTARQTRLSRTAEDGGGIYLSTYHKSHCHEENLPVISELRNDYLSDEPITLYTGNPVTRCTMTVHGKTPVEPVAGRSRFGRHTYFTERKYAL
ncbi:hypothetical protein TraAM80_06683 [Trypanosoma rangeli]|uniref:Uncharacterized protein n=1 Tax=Trypanosoma rangeli TaxID=5698 RepID=A0A3R7K5C5_TRYRA|nr:uncharacterized protein TraAM80_06683 [Trypanosoma rangeli]RNF01963.1 hypothetical protein TraAM80_06683 [Trypanosoma rangeli]|eukprot:RNF01963.1 hypothetical protein TraAM80_06683 [Trypanosoma rangeli]